MLSLYPIWVQGTLAGDVIRTALDLTLWEAATDLVRGWEAVGRIGAVKAGTPSLGEAVARYLDDCRARQPCRRSGAVIAPTACAGVPRLGSPIATGRNYA